MSNYSESPSDRPITLAEIGRKLGLSKATVSLALRGSPKVNAKTRKLVCDASLRLGYRPNPAVAAALRSARAGMPVRYRETIAVVCPDGVRPGMRGSEMVFEGARTRALPQGYEVCYFDMAAQKLTSGRMDAILRERGISGAIIACNFHSVPKLELEWDRIAVAVVGPYLPEKIFHRVVHDGFTDIRWLISETARRGYRRPGLVIDDRTLRRTLGLGVSAFTGVPYCGFDVDVVAPLVAPVIEQDAFEKWISTEQPDVILSYATRDVERHAKAIGLRIPEDVACAAIVTMFPAEGYSRICHDLHQVGEFSVDLVIKQLQAGQFGEQPSPTMTLIRGKWIEGSTVPLRKFQQV